MPTIECPGCAGSGDCLDCNADDPGCCACQGTGECPECDGSGETEEES
jgi:hypothetical protein